MPRKTVKYRDLRDSMRRRILSGEFSTGRRLPGQFALAEEYGVSAITANRALDELELSGLIERRARSGSYVLRNPRFISELFVVSSGKFENEELWVGEYWKGISERAEAYGVPTQMLKATDPMFNQKVLSESGAHGAILLGFEDPGIVRRLERLKIPHVVAAVESRHAKYCAVENRRQAVKDLTEKLYGSGARRVAFLGDMTQPNHRTASEGFVAAISRLESGKPMISDVSIDTVSGAVENLLRLPDPPDAMIIAGSGLPFASLPAIFKSGLNPLLGFVTDHQNVLQLKGLGMIASYSQRETGMNSFDLLARISRDKNAAAEIVYTKFEIIRP